MSNLKTESQPGYPATPGPAPVAMVNLAELEFHAALLLAAITGVGQQVAQLAVEAEAFQASVRRLAAAVKPQSEPAAEQGQQAQPLQSSLEPLPAGLPVERRFVRSGLSQLLEPSRPSDLESHSRAYPEAPQGAV